MLLQSRNSSVTISVQYYFSILYVNNSINTITLRTGNTGGWTSAWCLARIPSSTTPSLHVIRWQQQWWNIFFISCEQFDKYEHTLDREDRRLDKCLMPNPDHCGRSPATMTLDYLSVLEHSGMWELESFTAFIAWLIFLFLCVCVFFCVFSCFFLVGWPIVVGDLLRLVASCCW